MLHQFRLHRMLCIAKGMAIKLTKTDLEHGKERLSRTVRQIDVLRAIEQEAQWDRNFKSQSCVPNYQVDFPVRGT